MATKIRLDIPGHVVDPKDHPFALYSADRMTKFFGFPMLDADLQVEQLSQPLKKWGAEKQTTKVKKGSYHFFGNRPACEALFKMPQRVIASECKSMVEPDFQTIGCRNLIEGLYDIYKQRFIACHWQIHGVRICVNVKNDYSLQPYWFLGVPQGWKSYCIRWESMMHPRNAEIFYEESCRHRGADDVYFAVIGGPQSTAKMCSAKGWHWLPDQAQTIRDPREWVKGRDFDVEQEDEE